MQVDNTIYETYGNAWWDDDAPFDFASLRQCVNPARYAYFRRLLDGRPVGGRRVLDVGCGGGFLSEAFARDGFEVTGIDPASASIEAARRHAAASGVAIDYRVGRGESLPFPSGAFDIVACCDVLEHVDDLPRVIAEVSRVLTDSGVFLFDTVNRTRKSWFALIKLWQDWNIVGLRSRNVHVWTKFITPAELTGLLNAQALAVADMTGLAPKSGPFALLWTFLRIRRHKVPNEALASVFGFHETTDLSVSYMGWALRGSTFQRGATTVV